ncbi:MAG: hypothetical protein JOZ01_04180, partial [Candidatus Eremiobacteraeota bacterium]|nr:hypothetical protein [Candidatus Eremiobacteraeota bacterium]
MVLVLSGWVFVESGLDLVIPWRPYGVFGYSTNPYGVVTRVDTQAAANGLHVGDHIDARRGSFSVLLTGLESYQVYAPAGTTETVPLTSGKTVRVTAHTLSRTRINDITNEIETLALLASVVIASMLVVLRASPVTWAFYVFCLGFIGFGVGSIFRTYASAPLLWTALFLNTIFFQAGPFAFCEFALRFPTITLSRIASRAERLLLAGAALSVATATGCFMAYAPFRLVSPDAVFRPALLNPAISVIAIAILAFRYFAAETDSRNRLRWIVVSFALAFVPSAIFEIATHWFG